MLKNISLLDEVLKKRGPLGLMQDNNDFASRLKLLAPFFEHDFANATKQERKIFFNNLFHIAQQDLSLAHCIQHNHMARLSIELGPDGEGKTILKNHRYDEIICCYSSNRAMDTIQYDPATNTLTPGVKGWLSNLKTASLCSIEVAEVGAEQHSSAHRIYRSEENAPPIYSVFIDLSKVSHTFTDGSARPTAAGMKGAAPGTLTLLETVNLGTDACYILKKNPRLDIMSPRTFYVKSCWETVHLGVIVGLYNELIKYPETRDPALRHRLQTMELAIAQLKLGWESNLETRLINYKTINDPDQTTTQLHGDRSGYRSGVQYAASKKVLLDLIQLILEIGLNDFVDDTTDTWIRFKDAISYVTHMASLYRCNNKFNYME
jgi:hypothetical protein